MATLYPQPWEHQLFTLANEALRPTLPRTPIPVTDGVLLDRAYAHCGSVISTHGKTFYMASSLLPIDKRRAIRALYAFCRVADNIVDCSDDPVKVKEARLNAWRYSSVSASPPHDDP